VKPLAPSKKRSHFSPYTSSWKLDLSPSTSASLVAKPLYSSVNSPLSEKQTASTESQRCRGASPPPKDRDSDPEGAALGGGVWPHPRSNLDPERDPPPFASNPSGRNAAPLQAIPRGLGGQSGSPANGGSKKTPWGAGHLSTPQVLRPRRRLFGGGRPLAESLVLEAAKLFLEPLPLVGASTIATLPPENAVELGGDSPQGYSEQRSCAHSSKVPCLPLCSHDATSVSPTFLSVSAPLMPLAIMQSIAAWKAASSLGSPSMTANL
jgi:hypothetical protein